MALRLSFVLAFLFAVVSATAEQRQIPIADSVIAQAQSSNPGSFVRAGSQVFFTATDPTNGLRLWHSDGTAAGTQMISDIPPGLDWAGVSVWGAMGDAAIVSTRNTSSELATYWRTDGTSAGTWQLGTLPQAQRDPAAWYSYGSYSYTILAGTKVFVLSRADYYAPFEFWVSDGTENSLHLVGRFPVTFIAQPFGADGKLYFVAQDPSVGYALSVSDGTLLGTHMVQRDVECPNSSCFPAPRDFFRIGSTVCFVTDTAIYKIAPAADGITELAKTSYPAFLGSSDTRAYLASGNTIWTTDGTPAGTVQGPTGTAASFWYATVLDDGRLIYLRPSNSSGYDLWKTDGTVAGTVNTGRLPVSSSYAYYSPLVGILGTRVFLAGYTNTTGSELWRGDVDNGSPALFKDLDPRTRPYFFSSNPGPGAAIGGNLLFPATSSSGRELWHTDGSVKGTEQLVNIAPEAGGGIVTGVVRDATDASPINGASVYICDGVTTCSDFTYTNSNGEYRFEGVIPGTYKLQAFEGRHLSQIYDNVTVTAGFETTDVDFNLTRGGTISGHVVRARDGALPDYSYVYIYDASGKYYTYAYVSWYDGSYQTRALPAGTYYAYAEGYNYGSDGTLVSQVYNGHDCVGPCDPKSGDPIAVTIPNDTTNIDFALHGYGTIAGTVYDGSITSMPVGGVEVYFFRVGQTSSSAYAYADANGKFISPRLAPGSYYVAVPPQQNYNGQVYAGVTCASWNCSGIAGTPVPVTVDGATTGVNFWLPNTGTRIIGTVRDRKGKALSGIDISLYDSNGNYVSSYYYGNGTSRADGSYTLSGMAAGTYYLRIYQLQSLYPNATCYNSPCNVAGATPVTLASGQTVTFDMQLPAEVTTISGKVLDGITQQPVSSGYVNLYDSRDAGYGLTSSSTNYDGSYSVSILSKSTSFYLVATSYGYHDMAYQSVRRDCPAYQSCPIPANAQAIPAGTQTGFDFLMQRRGAITGTVTDENNAPVQYAYITLADINGAYAGSISTAANGTYRWPVPQSGTGSYYVYIQPSYEYSGQLYLNHDCASSCTPTAGNLVYAADGTDVTGIDFHIRKLHPTGKITGRVVDAVTGAGMADVYVSVAEGYNSTRTDDNGYYTLTQNQYYGPLNGQYHPYAEAGSPYYLALYGGTYCDDWSCNRSAGTAVQVTAPNTTANINFSMIKLGVTSVSPAQGPLGGGTHIFIGGTNFRTGAKVLVGGREATIVNLAPTQIEAITPAGTQPGAANVTVQQSYISVTLTQPFTYVATAPMLDARGLANAIYINVVIPEGSTNPTLYRRPMGGAWSAIPGWSPNIGIDPSGPARSVGWEYRVDVTLGGNVVSSNTDTAMMFTDDPLVSRKTVMRRYQWEEVRGGINLLRAKAGLAPVGWDATWSQPWIRASHLATLRTAVNEARVALGLPAANFSSSGAVRTRIQAIDLQELRELVR